MPDCRPTESAEFTVEAEHVHAKAPAPMSKPVLGRGLGSLLGAARTQAPGQEAAAGDPAGVQLLLRGTDGAELVLPAPVPVADPSHPFPRWALAGAVVVDGLLLLVAAWLMLTPGSRLRYAAAGLLIGIGFAVLSVSVWLRGNSAIRELESLNPLAEQKPTLRVQFMDEAPKRRD